MLISSLNCVLSEFTFKWSLFWFDSLCFQFPNYLHYITCFCLCQVCPLHCWIKRLNAFLAGTPKLQMMSSALWRHSFRTMSFLNHPFLSFPEPKLMTWWTHLESWPLPVLPVARLKSSFIVSSSLSNHCIMHCHHFAIKVSMLVWVMIERKCFKS